MSGSATGAAGMAGGAGTGAFIGASWCAGQDRIRLWIGTGPRAGELVELSPAEAAAVRDALTAGLAMRSSGRDSGRDEAAADGTGEG